VDLVRFRGEAMQAAVPVGQGAMAAILGLEDADVEAACREAAHGEVVQAANFNSPGQVVIAGAAAAVERAIELLKARGAKRAIKLPVSVPSHSALMQPAAERFAKHLETIEFRAGNVRDIYTVDVRKHGAPSDIRRALVEQLVKPVRWTQTIQAIVASGARTIVECGPGRVLTGLNRRIEKNKEIEVWAIANELARQGATVIGTATSDAGAQGISAWLHAAGYKGRGAVLNVADADSIDAFLKDVENKEGPATILVNNAGITRDNLLLRMKAEEWDDILNTNLTAVIRLSKGVLRGMMKARRGRIINIA